MEFQTKYGEATCNSTCGVPYSPTTYTPSTPTTSTPTTTTTIPELWNKTCVDEGKYYIDPTEEEYPNHIQNIKSWEHCAYLCKLDPECKGFTWAGPKYAVASIRFECALKGEIIDGKGVINDETRIAV